MNFKHCFEIAKKKNQFKQVRQKLKNVCEFEILFQNYKNSSAINKNVRRFKIMYTSFRKKSSCIQKILANLKNVQDFIYVYNFKKCSRIQKIYIYSRTIHEFKNVHVFKIC